MSNILRVWPAEEQERLFAKLPDKPRIYRDELKPSARKLRSVEAMVERALLLRPTTPRAETIYVACLGLLAWDLRDLGKCFAAAKARRATVVALNTGLSIGPDAGAVELAQAQDDFTKDKRRGAVQPGRAGYEVTAELKKADTLRRVELIRNDWGDPKFTQEELLLRAGRKTARGHIQPMAWKTARQHLNTRRWAMAHRAGMKRSRAKKGDSE